MNNVSSSGSWFERHLGQFVHRFNSKTRTLVKHVVEDVVSGNDQEKENYSNNKSESLAKVIGLYFVPVIGMNNSVKYRNEDITEDLKELFQKINEHSSDEDVYSETFKVIQICFSQRANLDIVVQEELKNEIINRCSNVPWFVLHSEGLEKNIRLRHHFGIKDGEFSLILLDGASGELITKQGYEKLLEDRTGKLFPWRTQPVLQILKSIPRYYVGFQTEFKDQTGDLRTCSFKDIDCNTIIGLYFSAHWCPPCKAFTSQLIQSYNAIKKRGQKFEIILVSSDRSSESYSHYVSKMPWLAIPYEDVESRNELTALYGIQGIPSLVLLNSNGTVITEDGRGEINDDPKGENFPWYSKPVDILTPRLAVMLQKRPAVVLFTDGEEDVEIELASAVLIPVCEYVKKKYGDLLLFFIAVDSDTSESIREYLRLEDVSPLVTLVDIPLGRFAEMEYGKEITEKTIIHFINQFYDNKLKFSSISRQ